MFNFALDILRFDAFESQKSSHRPIPFDTFVQEETLEKRKAQIA
jgi:hypothetical protein